jgi:hypothetical protein
MTRTQAAWSLLAIAIAMLVASLYLSATGGGPADDIFGRIVVVPVAAAVGALISARVPGNPIGWIFLGVGLLGGLEALLAGYADYALPSEAESRGVAETSAWISTWLWAPLTLVPLTFGLVLFPDGRLPSRRWRVVPRLAAVGIVAFSALIALNPEGEGERWGLKENPHGLEDAEPVLGLVGLLGIAILPALLGAVAPSSCGSGARGARSASSSSGSPTAARSRPRCPSSPARSSTTRRGSGC